MRRFLSISLLLIIAALSFSACGGGQQEQSPEENQQAEGEVLDDPEEPEDEHVHIPAPDEFETLTNPFLDDSEAVAAGKLIFDDKCARCHGPEGRGDGPEVANVNPKPADLGDQEMMSKHSDGYLFWRVTKGGFMEPFNSGMKPYEMILDENERWQVVNYVRTLSE